jgi:two-component system alkaline phosphatase synthesis response regulator PhoP
MVMIYLVEDDHSIRELILYTLNNTGMTAEGFENPSNFWQAIEKQTPDLLILDIMLPEEDGISILKKLRNNPATAFLPIIMLTAKSAEYDKVNGLDSGADDYITKPFSMMELISRIKALLRRTVTTAESTDKDTIVYEKLSVNRKNHTVIAEGRTVTVTLKEFELLYLLMQNPHQVFDRDRLLEDIWGYAFDGENRTVDVHIRTLRQKLGDCACYIETVRGIGYKLGGDSQ